VRICLVEGNKNIENLEAYNCSGMFCTHYNYGCNDRTISKNLIFIAQYVCALAALRMCLYNFVNKLLAQF